jgi:hypothetical protein
MDKKVKQLLHAYSQLTDAQKAEFDKGLSDGKSAKTIYESFGEAIKRVVGPLDSNVCSCCGK